MAAEDPDEVLRSIDFEEQGAGYQAAYSKLAASEVAPEDPVGRVSDPRAFVGEQLGAAETREPRIRTLVQEAVSKEGETTQMFVQSLAVVGYKV